MEKKVASIGLLLVIHLLISTETLLWKDKTDLALRCIADNVVDSLSRWYASQHGANATQNKTLDEVARLALAERNDPNVSLPFPKSCFIFRASAVHILCVPCYFCQRFRNSIFQAQAISKWIAKFRSHAAGVAHELYCRSKSKNVPKSF